MVLFWQKDEPVRVFVPHSESVTQANSFTSTADEEIAARKNLSANTKIAKLARAKIIKINILSLINLVNFCSSINNFFDDIKRDK